ncbi:arginine deiminase ArcA [[Clostridium] sordellii]|uniref:arginine deiminase n=1 Tax=Paraclostridium sordellii TaxID=1505 RepID=UPI0005E9C508|nr:arginine deiminase [Paeniclostridium sordellii]CEQ12175.1 arginine deiminase ArcA [[Clostridium] sordellii] [Paeniclostridium sordellii]
MKNKLYNTDSISVSSEIKPLKKVLLHRPGKEVENLTPETMKRLLFDDIPYLDEIQKEHDEFANLLRENGVEVVYLHDLMKEVLSNINIKEKFIEQFIKEANIKDERIIKLVFDYLSSIKDLDKLIKKTIEGIRVGEINGLTLKNYIENDYPFITDPIPNLYFTRDPFSSISNGVSINKMFSETRNRETIYSDYIFNYHKDFKNTKRWYKRNFEFSIEGGDILNLSNEVIAIGISQRTSPEAIEVIAKEIFFSDVDCNINTILAFDIPKTRAFMHLDTVFTQVDYDKFTIHPKIQGPLKVYEIKKGKGKRLVINKLNMDLDKILEKYLNVEKVTLIPCGGNDEIASEREQWNDGSNTLCIKPGEVIVYSRNYVTNELLRQYGIKTHIIASSELSRGRGGPRCMSMPLIREN